MRTKIKKIVISIALSLLGSTVTAATQTGNMTVSGTMTAPINCTLSVPATLNFGSRVNGTTADQAFVATVNCSSGASYSLSAPQNTSVAIGPDTNYLSVTDVPGAGGVNIATTPKTGIGTGANQSINLNMELHSTTTLHTAVPVTSVGSYSAVVTLTLTY